MYSEKSESSHKSTLQIKQDDKFFCRLLSKETSISNPSFRVTPVAVPFLWESHPGTPKHPLSDLSLPPLTPPPSYFYNSNNNPTKKTIPRSNLFRFSFSRFNLRKTLRLPSSSSSSLSSSSSSSDSSRNVGSNGGRRRRRRFLSYDSSADLWGNSNFEEDDAAAAVVVAADSRNYPSSCFGFRRSSSSGGGFGGCYGRQA